jgi:hypothetical protein
MDSYWKNQCLILFNTYMQSYFSFLRHSWGASWAEIGSRKTFGVSCKVIMGVFTRFMCDLHLLFIVVIGYISTWVILVIALRIICIQTIYFEGKTKLKSCSCHQWVILNINSELLLLQLIFPILFLKCTFSLLMAWCFLSSCG